MLILDFTYSVLVNSKSLINLKYYVITCLLIGLVHWILEYLVWFQIYRLIFKLKVKIQVLKVHSECLLIRMDFILELWIWVSRHRDGICSLSHIWNITRWLIGLVHWILEYLVWFQIYRLIFKLKVKIQVLKAQS